jgi:AcrR family transcriptional regulator
MRPALPRSPERIAQGREFRRSRIADAALRLFTERGFAPVTVEDIAEASGYTRVSVYNHFRGKPMIYLYLIQRETDTLVASIERVIPSGTPAREAFNLLLDGLITWTEQRPSFFFLYFVSREEVERDMSPEELQSLEESHFRLLEIARAIFEQGISEGVFHDVDAPTAANIFFSNIVGAILLHRTHEFRATLPQLLRATAHYFLRSVGAAQGASPLPFFAKTPAVTRGKERRSTRRPR